MAWQRPMQVYCGKCKKWIDTDSTEFVNIQEGIFGQDIMTFICPTCKSEQESDVRA